MIEYNILLDINLGICYETPLVELDILTSLP